MNEARKFSSALATGVVISLGAFAPAADAVELRQPGAAAENGTPEGKRLPASPSIRPGVVTRVHASGQRVEIDGQWYLIVASQTQLIQQGKPAVASILKVGQAVKFSLATGQDGSRRLGVLYVP
jgi:hypothetical protein